MYIIIVAQDGSLKTGVLAHHAIITKCIDGDHRLSVTLILCAFELSSAKY